MNGDQNLAAWLFIAVLLLATKQLYWPYLRVILFNSPTQGGGSHGTNPPGFVFQIPATPFHVPV